MVSISKNDFLEKLFKKKGGIKLGLGRVAAAFPEIVKKKIPVYHVAGTNGKGTAVYALSHILEKNGFTTGRFISPHLLDYNERIAVNGINISDVEIRDIYSFLEKELKDFDELSFFEITFLISWIHFEKNNCDRVVIEVGLGGRIDATNVIDWKKTDIITSIGLDHTHILGDTVTKIAFEKLGIVKNNDTVLIGSSNDAAFDKWMISEAFIRGADCVSDENACGEIEIKRDDLSNDQVKNLKLAVCAVKKNEKNITIPDFSEMEIPGRYQLIEPGVRVDVAHNPPAVKSLTEYIKKSGRKVVVLFGAMKDKDIAELTKYLAEIAIEIYIVSLEAENRGAKVDEVILRCSEKAETLIRRTENDIESMSSAIESSRKAGIELLVTGSFHTIEKFIKWRESWKK